jgi:hypothetical protein
MRNPIRSISTLLLCICLSACASVRKDAATGQPPRDPTPGERALAANLMLAQVNKSVLDGVILANASGVLPDSAAETAVRITRRVAQLDKELTPLLQAAATPGAAGDIAKIRALIAQIKDALGGAATLQALGIKNPKSQQLFSADLALVQALADQILGLIDLFSGVRSPVDSTGVCRPDSGGYEYGISRPDYAARRADWNPRRAFA